LKRFVTALEGNEKLRVQERLVGLVPQCKLEQRLKKSFKVPEIM
jgi:hypothetical protein